MKQLRILLVMPLVMALSGCLTNYYEQYYVDTTGGKTVGVSRGKTPVTLKTATTEDDVISLLEDGYTPIGYSSFSGPYTAMSLAVDTAENHDAALVLLDTRFKENRQYTSVIFLPSTSTSYSHGTVNSTVYGSGGAATAYGNYSGTTTTTTLNAVPVQRNVEIFSHDAMFFRKLDLNNRYGARFYVPKQLPTEAADAPIKVHILAVIHGTKAERDGLKRGQVVSKINGTPIRTRKDVAPYVDDPTMIKRIEVEK